MSSLALNQNFVIILLFLLHFTYAHINRKNALISPKPFARKRSYSIWNILAFAILWTRSHTHDKRELIFYGILLNLRNLVWDDYPSRSHSLRSFSLFQLPKFLVHFVVIEVNFEMYIPILLERVCVCVTVCHFKNHLSRLLFIEMIRVPVCWWFLLLFGRFHCVWHEVMAIWWPFISLYTAFSPFYSVASRRIISNKPLRPTAVATAKWVRSEKKIPRSTNCHVWVCTVYCVWTMDLWQNRLHW